MSMVANAQEKAARGGVAKRIPEPFQFSIFPYELLMFYSLHSERHLARLNQTILLECMHIGTFVSAAWGSATGLPVTAYRGRLPVGWRGNPKRKLSQTLIPGWDGSNSATTPRFFHLFISAFILIFSCFTTVNLTSPYILHAFFTISGNVFPYFSFIARYK